MFLVKAVKDNGRIQKFLEVEEFEVSLDSDFSASVYMNYARGKLPTDPWINRICKVDSENYETVRIYGSNGKRVLSVHVGSDTGCVFTMDKGKVFG